MTLQRKYATALSGAFVIRIPILKAGSDDFATGSDWTPAAGDVKVSIDGGAQANIAALPTYSNGDWAFVLSAAELTGKAIRVRIVDAATKAVQDDGFNIETFGNASAMYPDDITIASTAPDNTSITAIKAKTDNLPSDPADESLIIAATDAITSAVGTVSTNVSAVKAKTDNLLFDASNFVKADLEHIGAVAISPTTAQLGVNVVSAGGSYGIKKNTAKNAFPFLMTNATTHVPMTGLTVTAQRSIDGGAFAACANAVTEVASGVYKINLAAADLNGDAIVLKFTATGADQTTMTIITSP